MRHRSVSIAASLIGVLLLAGCATHGSGFQPVAKIPRGMAVIYIYRTPEFAGEALSYDVKANDKVVTTLRSGGYYPYVVRPGLLELWARTASRQSSYRHTTPPPERANPDLLRLKAIDDAAKSAVTLDVKAGQVYYVKGEAGVRYFVGRPRLQVVSPEQGAGEIRQCTLIRDETREARDRAARLTSATRRASTRSARPDHSGTSRPEIARRPGRHRPSTSSVDRAGPCRPPMRARRSARRSRA